MKKFLMMAAFAVLFAAPAFAEDAAVEAAPAVEAAVTAEVVPTEEGPAVETAAAVDVAAATEACTSETNEKVKLPENAGEAEKAQWDAALAECLKGKGVEETAASADVAVDAAVEAAPAAEASTEAAADAEVPAAE